MIITSASVALAFLGLQTGPLEPIPAIVVPGGAGGFDFMNVDAVNGLVLAAHPKKSGFAVFNIKSRKAQEISCCAVNGICADSKGHRVFAAGPDKKFVVFDSRSWKQVGEVALDGPGDCVQYDAKRGLVYVDNDDGTKLWIIDPTKQKITGTVAIKEAPEYMEIDRKKDRIYQAIKTTNSVQVIDLKTKSVQAEWGLENLTSPHGLAQDIDLNKIFIVGKNGILDILDTNTGKKETEGQTVKSSDQIAYDQELKRLYIPGSGSMEVIQIEQSGFHKMGTVVVPKGCHSVTVDPKTHVVWIAYSDDKNSYLQGFIANALNHQ